MGRNNQVSGGSTFSQFKRLISRGPTHKCSMSGIWYQEIDMRPDGRGGWVSKENDDYTDRKSIYNKSKFKQGVDWRRAGV